MSRYYCSPIPVSQFERKTTSVKYLSLCELIKLGLAIDWIWHLVYFRTWFKLIYKLDIFKNNISETFIKIGQVVFESKSRNTRTFPFTVI